MMDPTIVSDTKFICLIAIALILLVRLGSQRILTLEARLRADEVLERYEILKATADSFTSTIGSFLSNLLSEINDTNELLNQIPSSSPEGKRLYARLLEAQKRIQSPEIHALIIRAVNDTNDGIVDLFKTRFPTLAETQEVTFALCAGHVAPKIASLILDVKPKTYYVRRDRLREAIAQSSAIDADTRARLLDHLSNPRTEATETITANPAC